MKSIPRLGSLNLRAIIRGVAVALFLVPLCADVFSAVSSGARIHLANGLPGIVTRPILQIQSRLILRAAVAITLSA